MNEKLHVDFLVKEASISRFPPAKVVISCKLSKSRFLSVVAVMVRVVSLQVSRRKRDRHTESEKRETIN